MDISSFVVAIIIIIIIIFIVGARELRMKLKSYNIGVRMPWATGPRRKAARVKEEVSQGTLRHSKWELESEERERVSGHQGSFWSGMACCICIKWWATTLSATLMRKWPEQCKSQLSRFLPPPSSDVRSKKCNERRDVRWEWMVEIWWR